MGEKEKYPCEYAIYVSSNERSITVYKHICANRPVQFGGGTLLRHGMLFRCAMPAGRLGAWYSKGNSFEVTYE